MDNYYELIIKELSNYKILRIREEDLSIIEQIGEGAQGKVFKGKFNGNLVAIKALEEIDLRNFAHESYILSKLDHKGIPKLHGIVFEPNKNISWVTDYINGVTLDKYIKKNNLSFNEKLKITKNICDVLEYTHSLKVIHRDLKPENMIVDINNYDIYLIDFGISKLIQINEEDVNTRVMGTMSYMAPEIFYDCNENSDNQASFHYTSKTDVWSLGCIVSYLFSGISPWINKINSSNKQSKKLNEKSINSIIQNFLMKKEEFPIPINLDEKIKNFVERSTELNVQSRYRISDLKLLLEKINCD